MSYLHPDEFRRKYPQGKLLGKGNYGKVYVSGSDTVIKEIGGDTPFKAFDSAVKELDVYSQLDHPCIIKMLNWSYSNGVFQIALPLGTSVRDAVSLGLTTFWDVASDLLSGMQALYDMDVAHNDIKVENIVFHEGRVKLIDFGILTPINNFEDTSAVYIYLYTLGYRDPGGHFQYTSDYRFELYSVASVLATLFGGVQMPFLSIPLPALTFADQAQTDFYQDLLRYPIEARLTVKQLFQKYPQLTLRTGVILETPVYSTAEDCNSSIINTINDWIFGVASRFEMKIQTLFLALHLLRRVLEQILPEYSKNQEQKQKIQGLSVAYLSLATIVNDDPAVFTFKDGSDLSANAYTEKEIEVMAIDVLIKTRCIIITETPWNYARNVEELAWGFLNLFRCDYEVNLMAEAVHRVSRLVKIRDFYKYMRYKLTEAKTDKYSVLVDRMPRGQPRLPSPISKNYERDLLNFIEIELAFTLYWNKRDRQPADIYDLGAVLRHDYASDTPQEINEILRRLSLTKSGARYADIIKNQMIPFQVNMPPP